MVYRTDITVDSADELSTPKQKGIPVGFDSFFEGTNNCETARRTLSASSAQCAELESLKAASTRRQRNVSPESSAMGSQRTGVRWVIGSLSRRSNRHIDDVHQSQESYFADLDDSESDFEVDRSISTGSTSVSGPTLDVREVQKPCFMLRNPIYDCHTGVFGMAIGDEDYESDKWGQYPYHLLSEMHQRGPKPGIAARLLN